MKVDMKNNIKKAPLFSAKLASFFIVICFIALGTFSVFAQGGGASNTGGNGQGGGASNSGFIKNPLGSEYNTLPKFVDLILTKIVIPLGVVIIVFMIIFAGFQFVMAQGNPEKIKGAKATFFNAVIGAAIILGATVIASIIDTTIKQITG